MSLPSNVIDLDAHRPHRVGDGLCAGCGYTCVLVQPVAGRTHGECPRCGEWRLTFVDAKDE